MKRLFPLVLSVVLFSSQTVFAQQWLGTWATSPMSGTPTISEGISLGSSDMTLRQVVHFSQGGKKIRVSLTNEFGVTPLTLTDLHLQLHATSDAVLKDSDHTLKFGGSNTVTIQAGQFVTSDPIEASLASESDAVISFVVPKQTLETATLHPSALATSYVDKGDQAGSPSLTSASTVSHWYFLKDVQVEAGKKSFAIVALGDSITDGAHSTPDTNRRWPDVLAARIVADKEMKEVTVLNEGIGGNRILNEVTGPSALARLDRDVLNAPGVKYVILLEGINDIGRTAMPRKPDDPVTTEQILDGLRQIIGRAHAKGLKIIGATLTPYMGATYASPDGERMRQDVNRFIMTPGNFDGVIDFDKVTRDPQHPDQFLPSYNDGDHLHPNDAGYKAMADAIDLSMFR